MGRCAADSALGPTAESAVNRNRRIDLAEASGVPTWRAACSIRGFRPSPLKGRKQSTTVAGTRAGGRELEKNSFPWRGPRGD